MVSNAPRAADRIRKLGFKRWYERRLIESHLYLVSCFLCMIFVAVCLGEFSFRAPGLRPVLLFAAAAVGGWLGLHSWLRYKMLMVEAVRFVDRSTCASCGVYAQFNVVESGGSDGPSQVGDNDGTNEWLRVRCKKCGHSWTMP